jgi:hypothetical protein
VFALALDGARAPSATARLELATERGRRLRYDSLHVYDARRRELRARLELAGEGRIEIRVADAGAAYPILVDPILTGVADATLNPEPTFPQFGAAAGASVAFVGDVDGDGFGDVAVGAPFFSHPDVYEGAVAIFYGAPGGFRALFTLLDSNQAEANLGASVAGAGDVNGDGFDDVIVGAPRYDAGQDDEGAAFIFRQRVRHRGHRTRRLRAAQRAASRSRRRASSRTRPARSWPSRRAASRARAT